MDWAPANMRDYEAEQRSFSWDKARAEIAGLPGGRGLNIAHEIVDRYTQGRASTTEATMRAGDVMSSRVVSIAPRATVREAIALMLDNRISGLPVIEHDQVVGVISVTDLMRTLARLLRESG